MLNNNTDITNKCIQNSVLLEYNSNVIPSVPEQTPLSVDLETLHELNFSITDTHTRTLSNSITNALNCIQCNKARIYYFQNHDLPPRVQPATTPNISVNYIEMPDFCWFKHSISDHTSNWESYVIQGSGITKTELGNIYWDEGDIFILPRCAKLITHESLPQKPSSNRQTYLLWINDGPLLRYLGAQCTTQLFEPAVYRKESIFVSLQKLCQAENNELYKKEAKQYNEIHKKNKKKKEGIPQEQQQQEQQQQQEDTNSETSETSETSDASDDSDEYVPNKNRTGFLLSNNVMLKQKMNTLTPTLWSLYNTIAPNCVQKPHRHNSVALDYCVFEASQKDKGEVYTLMGEELNDDGTIKDPIKMVWKKGGVFITPPGLWHSHVNESNSHAYVFPIQDAGIHTYMNTLDIQFVD